MKALIDGDSIAYRAAASVEKTKYLVETPPGQDDLCNGYEKVDSWKEAREIEGGVIWNRREIGSLDEAKVICDSFIRRIRENTSNDYSIFLTPSSGNFRDSFATHTKYKANRDGALRPVYLPDLREYLCNSYFGLVASGHEAEDEVSIEAGLIGQDDYIIVGHDKDLLQIPGRHYDWVKNESFNVSVQEASDALWMQVLMGDRTDNIPGCWGMGFQKAKNRVSVWNHEGENHTDFMMSTILAEYEKSKNTKGCPYKEESTEETFQRVYETYWLVKLKEYQDEVPWIPKLKNNKKKVMVENGKTNQSDDTSTSECVQLATERGAGTTPIGSSPTEVTNTSAICATV